MQQDPARRHVLAQGEDELGDTSGMLRELVDEGSERTAPEGPDAAAGARTEFLQSSPAGPFVDRSAAEKSRSTPSSSIWPRRRARISRSPFGLPLQAILVSPRFVVLWSDVRDEPRRMPPGSSARRPRAGRAALVFPVEQPAGSGAVSAWPRREVAGPEGARTAGSPNAERPAHHRRPARRVPLPMAATRPARSRRPGRGEFPATSRTTWAS